MNSPYQALGASHFWKSAVADQHPLTVNGLYTKKFAIEPSQRIATAGSCFAQHIARNLKANGFSVLDCEPGPEGLSEENRTRYGYGLYSARYGNIYTTRHLLQLAKEAYGELEPQDVVWQRDDRHFDALRPSVEPNGLPSAQSVLFHRSIHLAKVREVLEKADILVFTMGLTEGWIHRSSGTTYPTAPGTIAGNFDPDSYEFKNFTFNEVLADFLSFREIVKKRNANIRFIITVSPVPLTATASDVHVLQATTYSKSVLRAVAGELYNQFQDIDYFPSYELIASPFSRGFFFESNLRSVNMGGVEAVMRTFFSEHKPVEKVLRPQPVADEARKMKGEGRHRGGRNKSNIVCEDELLEAFQK